MILYTSDMHFGHFNVIKFDQRPFSDIDEMNRVMIELWNGRVQPDDKVYIAGDICHRSKHPAEWYLSRLKGHKYLILGNHDGSIMDNPEAMKYLDGVDNMMTVKDGDKQICICHYPLAGWNAYFHGSWHIYGHIHNRKNETFEIMKKKSHALNAGCMINGYMPASFNELLRNSEAFKRGNVCNRADEEESV